MLSCCLHTNEELKEAQSQASDKLKYSIEATLDIFEIADHSSISYFSI